MVDRISTIKESTLIKQKRYYISLYIVTYLAFSFASTQFTPYLSSLGYDTFTRGILLSSYAITTLLFQMWLGILADKFQTIKKILAIALLTYSGASFIFFNFSKQHFFLHMIFIAISGGLLNTCTGLLDTWVLQSNPMLRKSLSFLKAFGSIGWALGSLTISIVVLSFEYKGLANCIFLLIIAAIAITSLIEDVYVSSSANTKKTISISDIIFLLKDKQYSLLLVILFLLYFVIICNNITIIDKLLLLDASTLEIGYKWSLQSLCEIPAYFVGGRLLQRFKGYNLLKVCAIALSIQFLLYAKAVNVQQMILISSMQIFTTPLLMISSKVMIYDLTNAHMKATGQMLALSIFIGLPSITSPIIASFLVQLLGIYPALLIIALFPLIAFVLIVHLKKMEMNPSQ